jgi:hypothetical protein
MPYPYDRYILGDWDDRIRQLANVFSSDSEYTHLKQELFRALDTLEGFCPREIADHFLRQAHIDETPDVIMHLLYDHRIKAGMTMSSFEETAAKILRESIRSK